MTLFPVEGLKSCLGGVQSEGQGMVRHRIVQVQLLHPQERTQLPECLSWVFLSLSKVPSREGLSKSRRPSFYNPTLGLGSRSPG
jgi:hypothetical protein